MRPQLALTNPKLNPNPNPNPAGVCMLESTPAATREGLWFIHVHGIYIYIYAPAATRRSLWELCVFPCMAY